MKKGNTRINWWKVGKVFSLPLLIFLFNLIIVAPLFQGEYSSLSQTDQPLLIKAFDFLSNSRPMILWAPFWQGGFSFPLFFTPVVPFITQIISFFGLAAGQTLRILSGLSYALIPLGLYFFVNYLTKRKVAGFIAAIFFSLHPSIMGAFFSGVRETSLSFFDAPWHFITNTLGDTPYILSLALIPITGAYFLYTLRKSGYKRIIICSSLIALTALTDFVSFFSLLILLFVLMFSEILLTDKTAQSRLGIFFLCLAISFGLFSFWYNPSFIGNFFTFGPGAQYGSDILKTIPYLILIVPWLIIGLFYIFGYRKHLQSIFISIGWFTLTFLLAFSYFFFGRNFMPEAGRYLVEMNMAFSIILGVLSAHFYDWLGRVGKQKHRMANLFRHFFLFGVISLIIYYNFPFIKNAWQYNGHREDITQEKVYNTAKWFNEKAKKDDSRIYITSAEDHWFNLFSDYPQISNPLHQDQYQNQIIRQVNDYFKSNEENKLLMLAQATDTEYFVVTEDYEFPDKFRNVGKRIREIDGNIIYKVNFPDGSLVKKVNTKKLSELEAIDENLHLEELRDYLAWQEEFKKTKLNYEITGNQKIIIKGDFKESEGVLLKINYDPGFNAKIGEKKINVRKDPFGFMVVVPEKSGELVIELKKGLSLNQWIGINITAVTIFFLILYRFLPHKKILKRGKKEFNIE